MLEQIQVDWIVRLLADGKLSQRRIARITDVSRGTVGAIARGKRPRDLSRRSADREPCFAAGPPARCRGCGGMVFMPCLLCRVRAAAAMPAGIDPFIPAGTIGAPNPALLECPAG